MDQETNLIVGRPFGESLLRLVRSQKPSRVFILSDRRFRSAVEKFRKKLDIPSSSLFLSGEEKTKRLKGFQDVIGSMIESGCDRKSLLVAVGGGVIGDLGGFAASVYMRGIPWVSVPTTLIGMVDSGIGGKTAVNHPLLKNAIGTFHHPLATVVDPQFLATLGERELMSGAGELFKYALMDPSVKIDAVSLQSVKRWPKKVALSVPVIKKALRIKSQVVEADPLEKTGERQKLNLGHTGAHAFETLTNFEFYRHGEAVLLGLEMALRVSRIQGHLPKSKHDVWIQALRQYPVPRLKTPIRYQEFWRACGRDKKAEHGQVKMVLVSDIGKLHLGQTVSSSDIMLALIEMSQDRLIKIS